MASGKGVLVLLTLVAVAAFLALTLGSEDAEGRTVFAGDVIVDHDLTWYDDIIEVHGNVTVIGGVHLTILQATVEIVGIHNGSHWFNATPGSTLTVDNGTIRGHPHPVGITLAGIGHMVDSAIENVWTSNMTPAIELSGAMTMLHSTVEGAPDSTGILVTGSLEAESCTFRDLGDVALRFHDPTIAGTSSLRNCTLTAPMAAAGDTIGVSIVLSEALPHSTELVIDGCQLGDFTYGIDAFVNSSGADLNVSRTVIEDCVNGLTVSGNEARVRIAGCTFERSSTVGLFVYVIDPLLKALTVTVEDVTATYSGIGIYVRGPVLNFRPLLHRVNVTGCDHGIQAMGATIFVEDSVVLDCTVCFYVENKARIEIRRTEHTYRSADIAPAQQAAVVAFSTVELASCWWEGGPQITEGTLFLHGDDGVELLRVDMTGLGRTELVVWSLTRFNDLGRLWVVPSIRKDGHEFIGHNFSIYNTTPQDLQVVDHLPPAVLDVWPEDGHFYAYDRLDASGSLVENGSGLARLIARLSDGQEVDVSVRQDGNWTAVFEPVVEGIYRIELEAVDRTGGTTVVSVEDLTVDVTAPVLQLSHDFIEMSNGTLLIPANDVSFSGSTEPNAVVHAWVVDAPPGTPLKCNDTVTSDDQGAFTVSVCPGQGFHTIEFISTDMAGNAWTLRLDIAMDAAPPAIVITEPRDIWDLWHTTSTITVRGNVTDPGLSEWVKVWVNGIQVEVPGGVLEVEVEVVEGESHIVIEAEDQAGHTSRGGVTVRVDTIPPDLRVITPAEETFFTTEIKVDLQGEVSDVNLGSLTLNGQPLSHVQGIFTRALTINEGENVFEIEATDVAGNVATRTLVITKDLTPPQYTLEEAVSGGELLELDGERYATGPGDVPVRVTLTFSVSEHTTVTASGGRGQVAGAGELEISFDLEEGENSVTFNLVDEAGNGASPLVYRITLDTTPPEIVVPGSDEVIRTKDRTFILMGRVEAGSTLKLNGDPLRVNADGTFSTQVDLSKGENVFLLEADDRVGLSSSLELVVERKEQAEESPGIGPGATILAMALISSLVVWSRGRRT